MMLRLVGDAVAAGASQERACELVGLDCRTLQRWRRDGGGDDHRRGPRTTPRNKITAEEDERLLVLANSPEFRDQSPRQIVPSLADRGVYIASESHLYLLLKKRGLQAHRARSRPPRSRPRALTATGSDQVYSWDITYLKGPVRGVYFYLYLVVDIWSRRIVGQEVHDRECGQCPALRHPRRPPLRAPPRHPGPSPPRLRGRSPPPPRTLERQHPLLVPHPRRLPQSRAQQPRFQG
jgi:putative transposase